jgi:hypothetical protein
VTDFSDVLPGAAGQSSAAGGGEGEGDQRGGGFLSPGGGWGLSPSLTSLIKKESVGLMRGHVTSADMCVYTHRIYVHTVYVYIHTVHTHMSAEVTTHLFLLMCSSESVGLMRGHVT